MQAFTLSSNEGKHELRQALEYLRQPQYYPTAISLYGRLSYGHFADTSYLISNGNDKTAHPRLYTFLDRSRRPETELWLFGQWEVEPEDFTPDVVRTALQALFQVITSLPVSPSVYSSPSSTSLDAANAGLDHSGLTKDDYMAHAKDSNIVLCGAVHEQTYSVLKTMDVLNPKFSHVEVPFLAYIFDNDHLPATTALMPGLRWDRLRPEHLSLVNSRTNIRRQVETMAVIPSIGVFHEGSPCPIAWGFVGVDGSLSTLHVEPEFRGQGLAKTLTRKLLIERMDMFFTGDAPRLGHSHVAHENSASRRLCESLKGEARWSVHWVRLDLSRVIDL